MVSLCLGSTQHAKGLLFKDMWRVSLRKRRMSHPLSRISKSTEPGLNKIIMCVREPQLFQVRFPKSICSGPVNCTQQMDHYCESSSDYLEMNTLTMLFLLHDPNTSPAAKRSIFSPFLNLNRDSTMIKKDRNLTDPERRHYPGLFATKPEETYIQREKKSRKS